MDTSIASETLTFYERFSERDSFVDRERGEQDGRVEYPPTHQTSFSTHEVFRISEARAALNQYVRRVRQSLDRLDEKIEELRIKRDHDYASRKRLLGDRKRTEMTDLGSQQGPSAQRFRELEAENQEATLQYQSEEFRVGRPPRLSLHNTFIDHPLFDWLSWYLAILLALALLEVPVNVLAVELAFGFNPPVSYIIAFLIGVGFVMLAHFIGIQTLRMASQRGGRRVLAIVLALLALLLALFMVFVLYEMRGQVTQFLGGGLSTQDLLGQADPAAPTSPAPAGPQGLLEWMVALLSDPLRVLFGITGDSTPADETRFAQIGLLLLNILVLLIGTVLSVARHDPDPELERAYLAMLGVQRRRNRFLRAYRRDAANLERQIDHQIGAVSRQADQIGEQIMLLQRQRQQVENQMQNDIRLVLNVLAQQIAAYQEGNRQARKTKVPAYFGSMGLQRLGDEILIAAK